jgi:cystathionine gamma-synthase
MFRHTEGPARPWRPSRETLAVLGGRDPSPGAPLNPPPVLASAFRGAGDRGYARDGNPTWEALESALGALEGGSAVAFSSGMAAISATLELLEPRALVVLADNAYGEVRELFERERARGRLRLSVVPTRNPDAMASAFAGADLVWLDAISNPGLDVAPVADLAAAARGEGALVAVDATLATPMLVRPLELGADVVVHSATKHIGGHSDLLAGVAVAAAPAVAAALREARAAHGAVPGTMDAWLALRGLRTLPLRIERGQATATLLAKRLAGLPAVTRVRYPGLAGDPAHAPALTNLDGFGTMLCFELRDGPRAARAVCEHVEVITHATSLGGVESLIERPATWTADSGASWLRISAGCEDPEDLWQDLRRAIALSAGGGRPASPAAPRRDPRARTAPR